MSSLPPTRGPVSARVVCRVRPGQTQTFKLRAEESVIGREPAMAIAVPLEGVSRHHARILWDGKNHWLEDMRSTNGTFLNGQRVERERLRHLDVVSLGKKVDLVFILRTEEAAVRKVGIVRAALLEEGADGLSHEIPMGEITLGRSAACNVQADSTAVSKVHARIERTAEQLVLQDLGSSNGTFVNGSAVMTAALKNGDLVSLAGLDAYKVVIEMGEITSGTGTRLPAYEMPLRTAAGQDRPRFSAAWKTRFEWDSNELMELAELHNVVEAEAAQKAAGAPRRVAAPLAPAAVKPTPPPAAAKPAPPLPEESGDTVKPVSASRPPVAPPVRPAAAAPPLPKPPAAAPPPRPAAPPPAPAVGAPAGKPAPPSPPPAAARPAPSAASPAPPAPPASGPPAPASPVVSRVVAGPPPSRPPVPAAPPPPAAPPSPSPARPPAAAPKAAASAPAPAPPVAPAKPPAAAAPPPVAPPRPLAVVPASAPPADLGSPAPTVAMETPSFGDAGPKPILEVALRGTGFDLAARGAGAHDIGRSSEAGLRLVHATVSRRHARLIVSDDRMAVYVQDVGGANGTRLNGRSVSGVEALKEGDIVGLGEVELTVSFVRG